jgi:hypothetical protein
MKTLRSKKIIKIGGNWTNWETDKINFLFSCTWVRHQHGCTVLWNRLRLRRRDWSAWDVRSNPVRAYFIPKIFDWALLSEKKLGGSFPALVKLNSPRTAAASEEIKLQSIPFSSLIRPIFEKWGLRERRERTKTHFNYNVRVLCAWTVEICIYKMLITKRKKSCLLGSEKSLGSPARFVWNHSIYIKSNQTFGMLCPSSQACWGAVYNYVFCYDVYGWNR